MEHLIQVLDQLQTRLCWLWGSGWALMVGMCIREYILSRVRHKKWLEQRKLDRIRWGWD